MFEQPSERSLPVCSGFQGHPMERLIWDLHLGYFGGFGGRLPKVAYKVVES